MKKIRQARAKAQQTAQAAQTGAAAVQGAQVLGNTSLSRDNALGAMVQGPQ